MPRADLGGYEFYFSLPQELETPDKTIFADYPLLQSGQLDFNHRLDY